MDIAQVDSLVTDYESRMGGNTIHYYFQMSDISVKANPVSFLSTTVIADGIEYNMEDICAVYQKDDYTFALLPNDNKYVIAIIKALKISHPEYKLEEESFEDTESGTTRRYLLCHMAEVNDERYDIYVDAINTKFDKVITKLNLLSQTVKVKVSKELRGAPLDVIKLYEDKLSECENNSRQSCEKSRDEKLKEVEEGYNEYLERCAEQEQEQETKDQSRDASLKMSM